MWLFGDGFQAELRDETSRRQGPGSQGSGGMNRSSLGRVQHLNEAWGPVSGAMGAAGWSSEGKGHAQMCRLGRTLAHPGFRAQGIWKSAMGTGVRNRQRL